MKNSQIYKEKRKNNIYEQVLVTFTCLKKNIAINDYSHQEFADRIEIYMENTTSGLRWVFYRLNNKWKKITGTTTQKEGKWFCDGSDHFVIVAGNERYSSKKDGWDIIDPVFNCLLNDIVDRHMDYSVDDNGFIVPFKNGAHYVFHKDYKWSNILTQTGAVLNSGTWKCDGDDEFEIISPKATFSSKRGWTKL
jgi:hypothetical protein